MEVFSSLFSGGAVWLFAGLIAAIGFAIRTHYSAKTRLDNLEKDAAAHHRELKRYVEQCEAWRDSMLMKQSDRWDRIFTEINDIKQRLVRIETTLERNGHDNRQDRK